MHIFNFRDGHVTFRYASGAYTYKMPGDKTLQTSKRHTFTASAFHHRRRHGFEVGGGHKLRREAPGNFFSVPPPPNLRCAPPQFRGHSGGIPQWKTDIVKITHEFKKQGTVDLATS